MNNFSHEWDGCYRAHTHMSIWPWSDLVSYVMRYAKPKDNATRVLELGCGAGANIPFFLALGVDFYAIDGSQAIVEKLQDRFSDIRGKIAACDFTSEIPFSGQFDLIVDRAALTCNTSAAIDSALELVHDRLKPGGAFIGIDWYSTEYSEYAKGEPAEDSNTRTGYRDGPFAGTGRVHFSDKAHLQQLFDNFELSRLEHKVVRSELPDDGFHFASWNLVANKR